MPATRCRVVWRVPVSRPWPESLSSGLASWWTSIFALPISRLARLAIGDDAHHFVNNVRPNPNFSILVPHRPCRPAANETIGYTIPRRRHKVGYSLVHSSPCISWTWGSWSTSACRHGPSLAPEHDL